MAGSEAINARTPSTLRFTAASCNADDALLIVLE
jgi:hypothetical protein